MPFTVLAFLAHPDDAEFFCAGTLIRLAAAEWDVHIATVTPGNGGTLTETPWRISATRTEEAARSAAIIGASYVCLDERDGMVVYDQSILQKSVDLFRRVTPSLVITHPADDYIMDHVIVYQLARQASFVFGAPNLSQVPLAKHAAIPHLYCCDPPEGIDSSGNLVEPTTLIDITDQLDMKTEMLACHASQREWMRSHHGMDDYTESMKRHALLRGEQRGAAAAEAFVQHRGHAYPRNDLLAKLLG